MKKKLSLLLVLALIVSLVPMSAFAGSENGITNNIKVKDDETLTQKNAPYLKIKNDSGDFKTTERFRLKIEKSEWLEDKDITSKDFPNIKSANLNNFENAMQQDIVASFVYDKGDATFNPDNDLTVVVDRVSDTSVEVAITRARGFVKDEEIRVPMWVEMQDKGEARVTIEAMDGHVDEGSYTFAIGAGGDTITTIDSAESFADICDVKTIQIDEAAIKAIGEVRASKVKLKLPTNFKWVEKDPTVRFSGGLNGAVVIDKAAGNYSMDKYNIDFPSMEVKNKDNTSLSSKVILATNKFEFDERTLEFYINTENAKLDTRGSIFISGLQLKDEKNAKTGDITMTISGDDVSTEDVVIAKYIDYDVTVKASEDPKELFAGRYEATMKDNKGGSLTDPKTATDVETDDDAHKLAKLKIEEEVSNSWITSRKTRIEFPTWIKVFKVKVKDSDNIAKKGTKDVASNGDVEKQLNDSLTVGDEYIEFTLDKVKDNETTMLELQFYASVEAGHEGDIIATVAGNAMDKEREIVIGKALKPAKMEVKAADVRTGVKNQALDTITIKESKAEAIQKGTLELVLEDDVKWTEVPTIKVKDGNIDLDLQGAKVKDSVLTIPVKSDSSKASTIEITDAKVDLTRSVAEGDIELSIQGDAVVENYVDGGKDGLCLFNEDEADKVVVARVITPADKNTKAGEAVKFVIGNAEYQVGEAVKTADVAPYIKDGRTMLSVRYVAEAMGVPEASIVWNEVARTVTVFKGERVAQVTIGSPQLMVNGTPVMMDTVAEIKDGRTMLPISFIAKALGAEANWDAATQTVTIK